MNRFSENPTGMGPSHPVFSYSPSDLSAAAFANASRAGNAQSRPTQSGRTADSVRPTVPSPPEDKKLMTILAIILFVCIAMIWYAFSAILGL
jgi:hypothetical protein